MSEYEPVDDTIEKQYSTWKAPETLDAANIPVGHEIPDNGEGEGRKFKANQLLVGDTEIERIKQVLESNNVRFSADRYTEPQRISGGMGNEQITEVPGEYVLTLSDPEKIEPATPEYVDQVVGLLKSQEIAVRYGNRGANSA